jgi:osmoprotectant transport system permease protein
MNDLEGDLLIDYIQNNYLEVITLLLQHIELTATTLGIAMLIAFPVGILLAKNKYVAAVVMPILSSGY